MLTRVNFAGNYALKNRIFNGGALSSSQITEISAKMSAKISAKSRLAVNSLVNIERNNTVTLCIRFNAKNVIKYYNFLY